MKRRTMKKRASRWLEDELRSMRRMRDKHYDAWAWIEIGRAVLAADAKLRPQPAQPEPKGPGDAQ